MATEPRLALVVDDEPSMRDIIVFALETQDFTTCTAGSAEAAWAVLQERQVDLVVLDVMLPGLSGVELCRGGGGGATPPPRGVSLPPPAPAAGRPPPPTTSPSPSTPASSPCARQAWSSGGCQPTSLP